MTTRGAGVAGFALLLTWGGWMPVSQHAADREPEGSGFIPSSGSA
ncbi:MAG TPA: hypothetical protein VN924_01485 [Bryobacteraceae bacterium]|nr:hypothetical protein [Bryobacteraceae bacterium]